MFVELVGTWKPQSVMFNKLQICSVVICRLLENHEKSKIHENGSFPQSMKIGTHEK